MTREKEQVAQLQSALKESQAQVEQQQAIATQATAAMKAAQSTAAAAAEVVKQEQETGAQCTEEAMRAMTAVDVQLQEAKVRSSTVSFAFVWMAGCTQVETLGVTLECSCSIHPQRLVCRSIQIADCGTMWPRVGL